VKIFQAFTDRNVQYRLLKRLFAVEVVCADLIDWPGPTGVTVGPPWPCPGRHEASIRHASTLGGQLCRRRMSIFMRRHEPAAWSTKRTAPCPTGSRQSRGQSTTFWPWRVVPFSLLTTGGVSCLFSDQVRIIALGVFALVLVSTMVLLLPAVWSRKPARRQAVRLLIRELRGSEPGSTDRFVPRGLHSHVPKTSKSRKSTSPPSSAACAESLQVGPGSGLAKPSQSDTRKAA
jgi:hypothetical protein